MIIIIIINNKIYKCIKYSSIISNIGYRLGGGFSVLYLSILSCCGFCSIPQITTRLYKVTFFGNRPQHFTYSVNRDFCVRTCPIVPKSLPPVSNLHPGREVQLQVLQHLLMGGLFPQGVKSISPVLNLHPGGEVQLQVLLHRLMGGLFSQRVTPLMG